MGWRMAVLAGVGWMLLVGTGCPENHRKGGAFDRAMRKDTQEQHMQEDVVLDEDDLPDCPPGKVAHFTCEAEACEWVCR